MTGKTFVEWFASGPKSFGVNLEPDENDRDGPLRRGAQGQGFLHQLCKAFISKVESVQRDSRLTSEGRGDAVRREAQRLLAELRANVKKFLDPLVTAFKNFDSTYLPALRRATDALEAVERLRTEQHIRALDAKQRVELLRQAMDQNDTVTLGVFFDRPQLHRLLDPTFVAEMRRQYVERYAPNIAGAEKAGAVLAFDFEKVSNELLLFAGPGVNADAVEVHKYLTEVQKVGWTFEPNADLNMMISGAVPSSLPVLTVMAEQTA